MPNTNWKKGRLHLLDEIGPGKDELAAAIDMYAGSLNQDRKSHRWMQAVQWIENFLFSGGRQYVDNVSISRISSNSSGDISLVNEAVRNIPRPVNDLLGRYVETNISLLTENKPIPRVSPKTNRAEDEDKSDLSELTIEYLWEALNLPEKHREIARIILHTGVCWMETIYDPTLPRRITVPQLETSENSVIENAAGGPPLRLPIGTKAPKFVNGELQYTEDIEYGDISSKIISPFELHLPVNHWWNDEDMGWIMREYYIDKDAFIDKYSSPRKMGLKKKDGWYLDNLEKLQTGDIQTLPLWWWERLSDMIEGPGPSLYTGTPELWEGHVIVRIFDRKPCPKWPRGRTIMVAGGKVIYDSPKDRGARAYNSRWPTRWHPYTRYRWEAMSGSMRGRSLVSKLLPKLKRVNAIDTTLIMWRRTVPIATWIMPKGTNPIDDQWRGGFAGSIFEYDPRLTAGEKPEPVFPPEYPRTALEERQQQIAEMEAISGTEEVLRGQRPSGATSGVMIEMLRKQALASRSAILQAWDESIENLATGMLQEVIKNVRKDPRYAERIRVIAGEKKNWKSIQTFSGTDISDNVVVRVDTMSQALLSQEAKEAKAIELMQYAPGAASLPPVLANAIFETLGYKDAMVPRGSDINKIKRMLANIRQNNFEHVIPMPEDDPDICFEFLVNEMKSDAYLDYTEEQQLAILSLIELYKKQIEFRQQEQMRMQIEAMKMQAALTGKGPKEEK